MHTQFNVEMFVSFRSVFCEKTKADWRWNKMVRNSTIDSFSKEVRGYQLMIALNDTKNRNGDAITQSKNTNFNVKYSFKICKNPRAYIPTSQYVVSTSLHCFWCL